VEEGEEPEGIEIKDQDSGEGIDWSEIFFRLHHYCHLNKWEIWDYTLPQVTELMRLTNKHIQFQVEMTMNSFGGIMGGGASTTIDMNTRDSTINDDEYHEVTEEDVGSLAKILGGG
jgi:hypothetical protein